MKTTGLVVTTSELTIYEGVAVDWKPLVGERVDVVLTNPYGNLPLSLAKTPMVIHQWVYRKAQAELWARRPLPFTVSLWNHGREAFWASDDWPAPVAVDLSGFAPEPEGWYPESMVRLLLPAYVTPGQTVWDGFMGRGTTAKVCREMGVKYIGVEQLPKHVALAREYLGI